MAAAGQPGPETPPPAGPTIVEEVKQPTTPPASAPAGEIQGITKDQLDQLVALKAKFNIQKEEWDALLQKLYNATSARFISSDQADNFINYLEKVRVPF